MHFRKRVIILVGIVFLAGLVYRHDFLRNTFGLGAGLATVLRLFAVPQSAGAFRLRRHGMTR